MGLRAGVLGACLSSTLALCFEGGTRMLRGLPKGEGKDLVRLFGTSLTYEDKPGPTFASVESGWFLRFPGFAQAPAAPRRVERASRLP